MFTNDRPEYDQEKNPETSHAYFIEVPESWTSTGKSDQKEHPEKNEGVMRNTGNPFPSTFFS
jgi:hypothetical protein